MGSGQACIITDYDQLYRRVYQKMYARLQPLYQAIQEITGYPAR